MDPKKAEDIASAIGLSTEKFRAMREESPEKLMNKVAATMEKGGEGATKLRGDLGKAATAFSKIGKQQDATAKAQEAVNSQFEDGTSLQKEMDIRTDTLTGQFKLLKNQISNAAVTIGDAYLPIIKDAISVVSPLIDRISEFISGLSETQLLVGTLVPTVSLLVGGLAALASHYGYLAPAISGVTTAFSALLGPIGLVVAGVAGLAAVVSGKLPQIFSTVDRVFGRLPDLIDRGVSRAIGWVQNTAIPRARQAFETLARRGAQAITLLRKWLPPRIRQAIAAAEQWVRSKGVPLVREGFDALAREASKAFDWLTDELPPKIADGINAAIDWVHSTGIPLAQQALGALAEQALNAWAFVRDDVVPPIRTALSKAWSWLRSEGVDLATGAFGFLVGKALDAWEFVREDVVPPVQDALSKVWSWLRESGTEAASGAFSTLKDKATGAWEFVRDDVVPTVSNNLSKVWSWLEQNGNSAADTAFSTLHDKATGAWEFAREDVVPTVASNLGKVWSFITQNGVEMADNTFSTLHDKATGAWEFAREDVVPTVTDALSKVWSWIDETGVEDAKRAFSTLADKAQSAFDIGGGEGGEDGGGGLKSKVESAIQGMNQWTVNTGIPTTKTAFEKLSAKASSAFADLKLKQKVDAAIGKAVTWVQNQGVSLFKQSFRNVGSGIAEEVTSFLEGLPGIFAEKIPEIRTWLKNNGLRIFKQGFRAIVKGVKGLFLSAFAIPGIVGQAVVSAINGIRDWLSDGGAERLKNAFIDIVTGIGDYLKGQAFRDLKGAAEFLFDAIIAAAKILYEELIGGSIIRDLINDITLAFENWNIVETIGNILSSIGEAFVALATDVITGDDSTIGGLISSVTSAFTDWTIAEDVGGVLSNVLDEFSSFATDIIGDGGVIKTMIGNIVSYLKNDAVDDLKGAASEAFGAMADAAKTAFNEALPDKIPSITVGGDTPDPLPDAPEVTIGGQSLDALELATGGFVEADGLAMLHAGEYVLNEQQVDRGVSPAPATAATGGSTTEINQTLVMEAGAIQGVEEPREVRDEFEAWWSDKQRKFDRRKKVGTGA
jgi:hypothetical protein